MRKLKKIKIILLMGFFITLFIFQGCITVFKNELDQDNLKDQEISASEKKYIANQLYRAIEFKYFDKMKNILENGGEPDYCIGEYPWIENNPLNVVAALYCSVSERKELGEDYLNPPDELMLNILLEAGADIQRRPYVWFRVNEENNNSIELMERIGQEKGLSPNSKELDEFIQDYIFDINRLLEAFIKAGADPDMLGHPYPYDLFKHRGQMYDDLAKQYFSKGTRAINVAIEKGIVWESQVDLLLKYVKLDKESLKAAKRSKDPAMIEKIDKLWSEQLKEAMKAKERENRN